MAQYVKTYQKCPQCAGTMIQYAGGGAGGTGPFPCKWPGCAAGDGYLEIGNTELEPGLDDIFDKCNDIFDKCNDILDKCDDILDALPE